MSIKEYGSTRGPSCFDEDFNRVFGIAGKAKAYMKDGFIVRPLPHNMFEASHPSDPVRFLGSGYTESAAISVARRLMNKAGVAA